MITDELTQEKVNNLSDKELLSYFKTAIINIQSSRNSEWSFTDNQKEYRNLYKKDLKFFEKELLKRMGDDIE